MFRTLFERHALRRKAMVALQILRRICAQSGDGVAKVFSADARDFLGRANIREQRNCEMSANMLTKLLQPGEQFLARFKQFMPHRKLQ
jgi:hypothetical protein